MRIKNQRKLSSLFMWLLYTTTGETEQTRVCESRNDQSAQNRRQKVFTRGALRMFSEAWYWKFVKISTEL